LEQELALKTRCAQLHHYLATAGQVPADPDRIVQAQQELNKSRYALDSLLGVLRRQYPPYFKWKYGGPVANLKEVQAIARTRSATFIEYFWGEKTLYAIVIGPDKVNWERLNERDRIVSSVNALRDGLSGYSSPMTDDSVATANFTRFCYHAALLHHDLLQPFIAIADTTPLIIVPDGLLGYLPFQILLTRDPDTPDIKQLNFRNLPYLLRQRPIQYEFSATALLDNLGKSSGTAGPYRGFAPDYQDTTVNLSARSPLPGNGGNAPSFLADKNRGELGALRSNRQEIEFCAACMGGTALVGAGANKRNFERLAQKAGVLHLAMHALTDNDNPAFSALVFSNTWQNAGRENRLFAYELCRMQLNTPLVVLSACNTGVGKLRKGEGTMSLARAFRHAGCPAIIMSLWPVDDAAGAEISMRFFTRLQQGQDKSQALRGAALSFLSETKSDISTQPGYWASLVLVGDPKPLKLPETPSYWLAYVLGLGGISVGIFCWRLWIFGRQKTGRA
ncbi:MAG: CHAT domain-containing protein, partial [Saprospiraceae bacterium]